MKNKKIVWLCVCLGLLAFSDVFASDKKEEAPATQLREGVQSILGILKNLPGEANKKQRRKEIRKQFQGRFDRVTMSRMTLRQDWKKLEDEKKKKFVNKFSEFVLSFYVGSLEKFQSGKILYGKVTYKSKGKKAIVKSEVEFQGKMAKLNYFMRLKGDKWLVYDVDVEGVRLTTTYMSQFQNTLRKKSFEGLIEELDKLIQKQKKRSAEALSKNLEKTSEETPFKSSEKASEKK